MSNIIGFIRGRGIYEAGFSGTVTVPEGVTSFGCWVQGAGGAGRQYYDSFTALDWDDGGGGGAFVFFESDVLESEWGTSLTLSVGSAVSNADGQASTLTGTLNGVAISLSAGGGVKALPATGGTASGGTLNIDGLGGDLANPGDGAPGAAGLAGGDGQDLVEIGGNGGLGVTIAENGYIALEWG
jgi:hypothetical protein